MICRCYRVIHRYEAPLAKVHDGGHPDINLLEPLARLGRDEWSTTGEILRAARIPYKPS